MNDAQQNGWLPKWAIADGDASQMNGDSADPIIASAYAFGIRDFDQSAALSAMLKGANENETGHGLEIERQYLSQYISQHYINAGSLDLDVHRLFDRWLSNARIRASTTSRSHNSRSPSATSPSTRR